MARPVVAAAEVGRLVPPVSGSDERLDHELEVSLHGIRLPEELGSPRMREAGTRLGLQLVAGQVLRPEQERLLEVGRELGRALAGDPVHEIEGDLVEPRPPQLTKRAPDGVRARAALEHVEEAGLEALSAERDAGDACLA